MAFDLGSLLESRSVSLIMGIVNTSGDSFSETAAESGTDSAVSRALELLQNGADILDIGGESTRPGAKIVSVEEELNRVIPVLKEIKNLRPDAICSIDTRHGEVAAAALYAGAEIINDVSMLRESPEIAGLVARHDAALILSHSRGTPQDMMSEKNCIYPGNIAETVAAELGSAAAIARQAGVSDRNILLDPGIGFAKTSEQCWELLRDLEKVSPLSKMLVGVSRKSFLGELTGEKIPARRGGATLAVELDLARRGAGMIRTHAVKELKQALTVMRQLEKIRKNRS